MNSGISCFDTTVSFRNCMNRLRNPYGQWQPGSGHRFLDLRCHWSSLVLSPFCQCLWVKRSGQDVVRSSTHQPHSCEWRWFLQNRCNLDRTFGSNSSHHRDPSSKSCIVTTLVSQLDPVKPSITTRFSQQRVKWHSSNPESVRGQEP